MKTQNTANSNYPNLDIVNNLILKTHETEEEFFKDLHEDYSYLPKVSIVDNAYSKEPVPIEIPEVVNQIKTGQYRDIINKIRAEESSDKRKDIKLTLPAIMFGGTFKDRSELVSPSCLVCIDFDQVPDIERLKFRLKFNSSVYMYFTSPSGNGLKVIVRTDVQNDVQYKFAIKKLFEQYRELCFFPDEVKQSINDLCFISYDPDIYFNSNATIYRHIDYNRLFIPADHELPGILETVCRQLEEKNIDLTRDNSFTYDIGLALANKLGEDGREYCHRICRLNDQYNEDFLNLEYNDCNRNSSFGSISSLIYLIDACGLTIIPPAPSNNSIRTGELSEYSGQPLNKDNILLATDGGLLFYKFVIPSMRGGQRQKKNVLNPFYADKRPSLNIYKYEERWWFKDYGDERYYGDVFKFAGHYYKLRSYEDFYKILQRINEDMELGLIEGKEAEKNPDFIYQPDSENENVYKVFYKNKMSKDDLDYWKQFGITESVLQEYKVKSVRFFTLIHPDKGPFTFKSKPKDPIFAYQFNDNLIKLYRPFEKDYKHMWIGKKENSKPFGYEQTRMEESLGQWDLIITGGEKDVMTLSSLGHATISLNSETSGISEELLKEIKYYFKSVLVLYDNDETGIRSSQHLAEKNGLEPVLFPKRFFKGIDGKDVSDYISQGGSPDAILELIEQASERYQKNRNESYESDEPSTQDLDENFEEISNKEKDSIEKVEGDGESEEEKGTSSEEEKNTSEEDTEFSTQSVFPTITDKVFDDLPDFIARGVELFHSIREQDVFLYSFLSVLSGALPNVCAYYDSKTIFPNLFLLIVAPPASSKGSAVLAKEIGREIHKNLEEVYNKEREEHASKQENSEDSAEDINTQKPIRKLFFIPADSSSTSFIQLLKASDGRGVLFDTEADTLGMTLANDWGNYSHHLRKIFQHEALSISRVGYDEVIEINEPKVSVVLSGTAGQIRNLIKDVENGLFSRFMFYSFDGSDDWKLGLLKNPGEGYRKEKSILRRELLEFYKKLSNLDYDIIIKFTDAQSNQFDQVFQSLYENYKTVQGEQIAPTVKRIGLITVRIAMVLTSIRYIDKEVIPEEITCSDTDFKTAVKIANCLTEHGSLVSNLFPKDSSTKGMTDNKANYYNSLSKEFTTQDAYRIGESMGIPQKTAGKYLKDFIDGKILSRAKHGHYRKGKQNL